MKSFLTLTGWPDLRRVASPQRSGFILAIDVPWAK